MLSKAQSTIDYVMFLCIVAFAFVAMSGYIKRGIQGRLDTQADELAGGSLYSPGATRSFSSVTREIKEIGSSTKDLSENKNTFSQNTLRQESLLPLTEEPLRDEKKED